MSVTMQPEAVACSSGKPPGHLAIHVIGTPVNSAVDAFAACLLSGPVPYVLVLLCREPLRHAGTVDGGHAEHRGTTTVPWGAG